MRDIRPPQRERHFNALAKCRNPGFGVPHRSALGDNTQYLGSPNQCVASKKIGLPLQAVVFRADSDPPDRICACSRGIARERAVDLCK
ncbi:hypothetical protein NliqN6_1630 [Naganishia liquefaciens]|uniref:Uncharacterized protein n=1 Tax=Naganishia liquefaciens TaxID=104408 RepID=A0A8H3TQD7_9TREE|nr:hypothetical protein NliqN6_1630 [Naganishia liquefaciens]